MAARIDTVPKFELSEQEVELMSQELEEYHAIFSPLYQRREQRERSLLYQQGLLSNLPRKAAETMVLHLKGDQPNEVRALQSFVSQGSWSDSLLLESLCIEVDSTLGEDDGVLLLDGSDFPKQGNHSVGVKRQRCGQLGKTANCQAGVFLGYASSLGYALLNRRLCMPKEWLHDDDFSQLREDCGVPEGKMTGMRWPIEMCFEDGKQLVGVGDYEVRGWLGWHHHMTMVILAYFFLIKVKVKHQEKAPALTVPQVQLLLSIVLPKREYDTQLALEILRYRQRRNHAAYLSHRKQRMHRMKGMETSGRLGQSCGGTAFSTEPSL